jgi:para-aminobenzoate synthetase
MMSFDPVTQDDSRLPIRHVAVIHDRDAKNFSKLATVMYNTPKILVVDNYDSFTFNLVNYFERSVKVSIEVVKNDDIVFLDALKSITLTDVYCLIVLSPGPGNPYDDIGCVSEYIISSCLNGRHRDNNYPVLFGVCMGLEAIGVRCGIPLVKTVPRHGERWLIHIDHDADAGTVFRGLPTLINQVRYHSLILDPQTLESSPDLIVTSRCEDVHPNNAKKLKSGSGPRLPDSSPGWLQDLSLNILEDSDNHNAQHVSIPMSFRHRSLPIYGVQFHPESVLSDFGLKIIENICRLAHLPILSNEPYIPKPMKGAPIISECVVTHMHSIPQSDLDWWTLSLYRDVVRSQDHASVWLDTPVRAKSGRWSFMAGGRLGGFTLTQNENCEKSLRALTEDIGYGEEMTDSEIPVSVPLIFSVFGYETEKSVFLTATRVLAVDNQTGRVFALSLRSDMDWIPALQPILTGGVLKSTDEKKNLTENFPIFKVSDSKSSYVDKILACKCMIEQGESYELCLTTRVESVDVVPIDSLVVYSHLRSVNPAHNSAFFEFDDSAILMASPERFLRVGPDRVAEMKPIKGTRKRDPNPEIDKKIKQELQQSDKDRAENLMIVDLVRNDLSMVCDDICCPTLMSVETYAPYHQLVSTVQGRLKPEKNLVDLILALFPAGSMTGAPKTRSMDILRAIEGRDRGSGYSGAIGYISPRTGSADLAVSIRSILINKSGYSIGCGGAIIAVSNPEEEWKEMILKAKRSLEAVALAVQARGVLVEYSDRSEKIFIRAPVEKFNLVTTMRYEEGRGVWLFNRHIGRLSKASPRPGLEADIIACIHAEAQKENIPCTSFERLSEGPFEGISNKEWIDIGSLGIAGCRIRIEISADRIKCELKPLTYENPRIVRRNAKYRVDSSDNFLRVKSNEWFVPTDFDRSETLLVNDAGDATETGIANIAVQENGDWITPPESCGLLPGTLRAFLIEHGYVRQGHVPAHDLQQVLCFNSVRGVFISEVV